MKSPLNKWFVGQRNTVPVGCNDNRPPDQPVESQPVAQGAAESTIGHVGGDTRSVPAPGTAEATTSTALPGDASVQAEANTPPVQLPVPPSTPTETIAPSPDENNDWLRDQLVIMTRQIELQGNRLQKIEEAVGLAKDSRQLLEEQEELIQNLTTRLREAEEKQITLAIMEPVVSGLLEIFDTVWNAQQSWKQQRPANIDEWITNCLATIEGEIIAMLNRHGVVMIQDTTDVLNPGKQRVVRTEYPRQVQDGAVWARLRPGFYHNGRVVRPEEVVVAKVKP